MFLAICMMVTFLAQASLASDVKVSPAAVRSFEGTFLGASNVQWTMVKNLYKVSFKVEEESMFAFYSTSGDLVATAKFLTVKQLPKSAQKRLASITKDANITEVYQITDTQDRTKYYVTLEKEGQVEVVESNGSYWTSFTKK